ncbi:MAG: N-acetylmuramoyl-L-alanine amidase [Parachlamydiales bacterium]|jgi:N-acetylmuramoyl-L-alanine amidase
MIKKKILILCFFISYVFCDEAISVAPQNNVVVKPIIILDAGHGGLDKGAKIRYPYLEEKRLAMTTVLFTKKYLEQYGYKVLLTRDKDYFVPLKKRVDRANNLNAEIFVSVHFNSCPNKLANGIEIYFHDSNENKSKTKHSKNLANCVLTDLIKNTSANSRGIRKGDFVVVKETKMPSILIEAGFLTNSQERDNIRKKTYLEKISLGIAEGIDNFIKKHI